MLDQGLPALVCRRASPISASSASRVEASACCGGVGFGSVGLRLLAMGDPPRLERDRCSAAACGAWMDGCTAGGAGSWGTVAWGDRLSVSEVGSGAAAWGRTIAGMETEGCAGF